MNPFFLTPYLRLGILLFAAGAALFLSGCRSPHIKLTPAQEKVASELTTIDPASEPLAASTSIIDVHTHTFNVRYLPLRGVLLGKRDAFPPVTWLLSDHCATLLAQSIVDRTELADIPGQSGLGRKPDTSELRASGHPGLICLIFLGLIDKAIQCGVWDEGKTLEQKMELLDDLAANMTFAEKLAVKAAMKMMGMNDHIKGGKKTDDTISGLQAGIRFLWVLTQNDARMPELFRWMHAGTDVRGQITMISHMMDLGPVYDQAPDGQALLDFETDQLKRMQHFQSQTNSSLLYFVAYNPYRDSVTNARPMAALNLVSNACLHQGATGVKVYPPSGYRPMGNRIRPRPCALFTSYPGRQWDGRYKGLRADKNKSLDSESNALLEWCIENDVPVLAHSGYGEFEARKGYGKHHSNPKFWKRFLEAHSTNGQPCKLRLCLGHAGGEDYWFGRGRHKNWGETVYQLCTNYPNVYCEITTSEKMIEPTTQAYFVDNLIQRFVESENAPHPFATKLLYGTDWPLPDQGEPRAVLRATQQAFLHPKLKRHYAGYFSANARRFLKLPDTPALANTDNTDGHLGR